MDHSVVVRNVARYIAVVEGAVRCALVPRLAGPSRLPSGGPLQLDIDIPEHPGKPYVTFACASVYPGLSLPLDARRTPCNPDPLWFVSATIPTWTGMLSTDGRAQPTTFVPPLVPPPSFRLYVQALALDAAQPTFIAALSNVHVLVR